MNLINIVNKGTNFGTLHYRHNIFSFTIRLLFYVIPAIILGYYTDIVVKIMQFKKIFGTLLIYYILLQTLLIILTLYSFVIFLNDYMNEFQETIGGAYFIILYFGIQTNYVFMIREFMNLLIKVKL
jgi:hypothetical protein